MREPDRAGIVRPLGLPERAPQERDAARRFAARDRQAPVQAPEFGEPRRMQPFAFFRRLAERVGGLADVVLLEPRFGQRAADLEMFVAGEPRLLQRPDQQRRGLGAVPLLQGVGGLGEELWERHAREYTAYTPGWIVGLRRCARRHSRFARGFPAYL